MDKCPSVEILREGLSGGLVGLFRVRLRMRRDHENARDLVAIVVAIIVSSFYEIEMAS